MSFRISRSPCCVIFAVLPLALAGCHLFSMSAGETSGSAKLPRLVAPRDSVQLEIVFVDRPESDPLIGEALWEKVDQIAGFSSDERNKLRKNGWRIGQCSSHPPQALEELMKAVGQPEAMDGDRRVRILLLLDREAAPLAERPAEEKHQHQLLQGPPGPAPGSYTKSHSCVLSPRHVLRLHHL